MEILQKVIFGGKPIQVEQKGKFLLTGYFLLIYIGIDIFFLFVNLFNQKAQNIPILIGLFVSVGCLLFLRMDHGIRGQSDMHSLTSSNNCVISMRKEMLTIA